MDTNFYDFVFNQIFNAFSDYYKKSLFGVVPSNSLEKCLSDTRELYQVPEEPKLV